MEPAAGAKQIDDTIMPDTNVITTTMSPDAARELTDRIRQTADQLWRLLADAHDGRAWQALGYQSFRDYAKAEFGMAKSHAYRLLDQARVIKALSDAAQSPMGESIVTERLARDVKPHLHLVVADVRERVNGGQDPAAAVLDATAKARRQYVASRKSSERSNRIVENTVLEATLVITDVELINFAELDPRCVDQWVSELNLAADQIRQFARTLRRHARSVA